MRPLIAALILCASCYAADSSYLYTIAPPRPWGHWLLIQDPTPTNFMVSLDDPETFASKLWLDVHSHQTGSVSVSVGTVVKIVKYPEKNGPQNIVKVQIDGESTSGFIDYHALRLTPESEVTKAQDDATAAADRKKAETTRTALKASDIARLRAEEIATKKRHDDLIIEARKRCATLYGATANKKVGDLTVKEEQQVRACQAAGIYQP